DILTAAHVVDANADRVPGPVDVHFFAGPTTQPGITIHVPQEDVILNPDWNRNRRATSDLAALDGYDLAILRLPTIAPAGAERYQINDNPMADLGSNFTMVGYGYNGAGSYGYSHEASGNDGNKRA